MVEPVQTYKAGEQVLIVTEISNTPSPKVWPRRCVPCAAEPTIMVMIPAQQDSRSPPPRGRSHEKLRCVSLRRKTGPSPHTQAVKSAVAAGSRGLVLTHFSEDMLNRGSASRRTFGPLPCLPRHGGGHGGSRHIHLYQPRRHQPDLQRRRTPAQRPVRRGGCGSIFSTIPTIEANVSPVEGSAKRPHRGRCQRAIHRHGGFARAGGLRGQNGFIISMKGGEQAGPSARRPANAKTTPTCLMWQKWAWA